MKVHPLHSLSSYVCLKWLLFEDLEEQMRSDFYGAGMGLSVVYPVPQTASRWHSTVGLSREIVVYTVNVKKERRS